MSRLLRRDAFLEWITPRDDARSSAEAASRVASIAAFLSLPSRASRARFTAVRACVRTALFRSRRLSFCRIRFFADSRLAKVYPLFDGQLSILVEREMKVQFAKGRLLGELL